ncbi:MAG: hypothetical protein KF832_23700 [Caldilineaceae bacterium]|nr:hypothetical protein [Caldilineaceae bacterium]
MRKFSLSLLFVVALMIGAVLPAAAQEPNPGTAQVNFTFQNLSDTTTAGISIQFVNTSGSIVATSQDQVAPKISKGSSASGWGSTVTGFEGSVIVSSTQDGAAFAQIRWQNNGLASSNTRYRTAAAYNGFSAGATTLYFPSLSARQNEQYCNITIQSAATPSTSEQVTFNVKLYDRTGALTKELANQTTFKGAAKTFKLPEQGLPATWLGSAVVTSANNEPLVGAATCFWNDYSAAYSARTGGASKVYVPEARRRLNSAGQVEQYTALLVQNLSTTSATDVTLTWYNRQGVQLYQFTQNIPANASKGFNTRFNTSDVPDHNALFAALGGQYNGSVVIESTNNVPIAGIVNLQFTSIDAGVGAAATAYEAETGGHGTVYIPATFRLASGGWKQFTGAIVQNVGTTACNNFNVEWFDRQGTRLLNYTDSLNAGISHGYNTRYVADIPASSNPSALGENYNGSMVITAPGCQLIAIHNTLWPDWTDSTTYNAFGK